MIGLHVKHLCDQVSQPLRVHRIDGRVATTQDLHGETVDALRVESVPQVAHLVQDTAEGPHIALIAVSLSLEQLR